MDVPGYAGHIRRLGRIDRPCLVFWIMYIWLLLGSSTLVSLPRGHHVTLAGTTSEAFQAKDPFSASSGLV